MVLSPQSTRPPSLLGLSGSLRRGSYCTAVLRTVAVELDGRAKLQIWGLADIPPFNEDHDDDPPAPVRALKGAIADADGIVVVCPEYNHGMSGVLKNAIDWVSRPGYESVLVGKPVLLATASPTRFGGVRAHTQLLETFASTLSRIVPGRQIAIQNVQAKVEGGLLRDAASLKQVTAGISALLDEVALLRGGGNASL